VPNDTAAGPHRIERALVAAAATVLGLSVIALVAVLIISGTGATLDQTLFSTLRLIPLIGMPIGALLILGFVIASSTRRLREARDAGR
jgi:hypothetical protein